MKVTVSVIKADIGSIAGHVKPSQALLDAVARTIEEEGKSKGLIIDSFISHTGDDVAILMTHDRGELDEKIHQVAWNAFLAGTEEARNQGLYGAGQDLLKDAFAGNVKGMGPAVAEIEMDERPAEPFLMFAADKTDPGAYNLPLYLSFADPMHCPGLMLSPDLFDGYRFSIMDVMYTEGDRVIELDAPEDLYNLASLLRDGERFVVESIRSRSHDEIAAVVSTSRLRNIAGKYTGKDDPVALVRVQNIFPATGEILSPYAIGPIVPGSMRGSHQVPLIPVRHFSSVSYFDGPPCVACYGFSMREGRLTEAVDPFDHPYWDHVRDEVSRRATEIRRQGFYGAAMLPYSDLEYGGIVEKMKELDERFTIREDVDEPVAAPQEA